MRPFYRLAADVEILQLEEERFVLRSDAARHRLDGPAARLLATQVLPRLDGTRGLDALAAELEVDEAALARALEPLVEAGIVLVRAAPHEPERPSLALWERVGLAPGEAEARLARATVAVLGLEGPGAHAALTLAQLGVGKLLLVDPEPIAAGHRPLLPPGPLPIGQPRQRAVRELIAAASPTTEVAEAASLSREAVLALLPGVDLAVSAFDKSMSAAHHWTNRASIAHGIPAIYAGIESTEARVGPLVLPHRTACFMCYRMRAVACEDDHAEAMQYERALDARRAGRMAERPLLPTLSGLAGALLAQEAMKLLLGIEAHSLAGRVAIHDGMHATQETHVVLRQPQCPVCSRATPPTTPPGPGELDGHAGGIDLRATRSALVSAATGVVRHLVLVPKDASEPALPYVVRAELANQLYLTRGRDEASGCSGKGITLDDAKASAVGEAVERYSASLCDPAGFRRARRHDLDGAALDPRELVLYAPAQYRDVPYAPYSEDLELGWISARSLVHGNPVWIPAIAAYLGYDAPERERLFAVTSSGLATGTSLRAAITGALEEVLERDAFVIAWLQRLPAPPRDPAAHPDPDIRDVCAAYARRGVRIALHRLPTDHPATVFAACAIGDGDPAGPAVVVGLGASLDPAAAARRAVLEVAQIRPALRRRMRTPAAQQRIAELVAEPRRVESLEDHDLLYTSLAMRSAFARWFDTPPEPAAFPAPPPGDPLTTLLAWFRAAGQDILYVDLTTPDMRELGLYTARVIVPGYQPIDFGWKERRLGGTRLYELPRRLGLPGCATGPDGVDELPHPLS